MNPEEKSTIPPQKTNPPPSRRPPPESTGKNPTSTSPRNSADPEATARQQRSPTTKITPGKPEIPVVRRKTRKAIGTAEVDSVTLEDGRKKRQSKGKALKELGGITGTIPKLGTEESNNPNLKLAKRKSIQLTRKKSVLPGSMLLGQHDNASVKTASRSKMSMIHSSMTGSVQNTDNSHLQPLHTDHSSDHKFLAKCCTRLEESFPMGPGFDNRYGCTSFARNVLAVLGLKMVFPTFGSGVLTYCRTSWNVEFRGLAVAVRENYWIIFASMLAFVYSLLYLNLRTFGSRPKCRRTTCIISLIVFTTCETCIAGVLTLILPLYMAFIISVTMTITCLTIAFYCFTSEIEVRGSCLYLLMIPIILMYGGGTTISISYFVDGPVSPVNSDKMVANFLASFFCSLLMLTRLMAGRRVELTQGEWTFAALIVPISFLYPANLIRRCQRWLVFPSNKVHPASSTRTDSNSKSEQQPEKYKRTKSVSILQFKKSLRSKSVSVLNKGKPERTKSKLALQHGRVERKKSISVVPKGKPERSKSISVVPKGKPERSKSIPALPLEKIQQKSPAKLMASKSISKL